ncbi:transcription factor Ouib [Drosophila novamexicana]|uniref:transcription factor Ouib n=1 Tax=Drosophila novamexicana TaxID=47314 RepID=UPI0011E5F014|nr:transcription factor Ouib [Drosophila novamexicana]
MSTRCRTCGKIIYCLNSKNLFQQPDNIMLHQIAALTGIFLPEHMEFPEHICGPCEVALREAIVFRERIIKTQQLLLNSNNIADAFQKIDKDEVDKLDTLQIDGEEMQLFNTYEDITECESEEYESSEDAGEANEVLSVNGQADESVQTMKTDEPTIEPPANAPASMPNTPRRPGRPPSKLYATVNFATNARNTPRINWSKLSEDEIVALKRERRKRDCICELCGRHFTCPSNFKVHLLRHTGVKNFTCKQCPLKFYTPHLLRRHELAHLCEKPYPCQYCGQTFADHSGRIQHERNRHTNYRPYKCTKCDKAFVVSNKLKRHMLSHSGVRSFHCEICKVSFMRRPHLNAHYRSKGHEQNAQNYADLANNVDIDIENVLQ